MIRIPRHVPKINQFGSQLSVLEFKRKQLVDWRSPFPPPQRHGARSRCLEPQHQPSGSRQGAGRWGAFSRSRPAPQSGSKENALSVAGLAGGAHVNSLKTRKSPMCSVFGDPLTRRTAFQVQGSGYRRMNVPLSLPVPVCRWEHAPPRAEKSVANTLSRK